MKAFLVIWLLLMTTASYAAEVVVTIPDDQLAFIVQRVAGKEGWKESDGDKTQYSLNKMMDFGCGILGIPRDEISATIKRSA